VKIHTLRNRWLLTALSVVGLSTSAQSQVLVSFEQVDDDVIASWNGTIDLGAWITDGDNNVAGSGNATSVELFGLGVGGVEIYNEGIAEITSLAADNVVASPGVAIGFSGAAFFVGGVADGMAPASSIFSFSPLVDNLTFANVTLADIGADSFDNTLAWTSSAGGVNTVSFTTIPEPSSSALLGLGALGLIVRRRR